MTEPADGTGAPRGGDIDRLEIALRVTSDDLEPERIRQRDAKVQLTTLVHEREERGPAHRARRAAQQGSRRRY